MPYSEQMIEAFCELDRKLADGVASGAPPGSRT